MILDGWRREERDGLAATSMRVRWSTGDVRTTIAAPAELAGPEGDASPWVAALWLLAMTVHEDLETDALVSARMRRALPLVNITLNGWDPRLRPATLGAAGATPVPDAAAPGVAGLMSRGVDSLFTAAVERTEHPLTTLVHWRGLEPVHGPATAAAEEDECRALADRLGLPLVVGGNDLRTALDRHTIYHDAYGGLLAGLALSLGGGVGRVVIPGSDSARSFGPTGSSPVLDGCFSSEWVEVEHDFTGAGRMAKVAALATQRPDLLPHLKVCFQEDRRDNCGRCGKCVITMCALAAAGGSERAAAFPALDLGLVRAQRPSPLHARHEWAEILLALGTTGAQGELRRAMDHALRRAARPGTARRRRDLREWLRGERPVADPAWRAPERGFNVATHARAAMLLRHGRPDARPSHSARTAPAVRMRGGAAAATATVPLLRSVDLRARHHRYAAGTAPSGEPAGELGGLVAEGVPLRLDTRGLPVHPPLGARASRLTWTLAPLRFAAVPPAARVRGVAARLRDLARPRPASGEVSLAGHLHPGPGPGRVPLLLADHPVLADRLLTTSRAEAADLGYGEPVVLGYLVAGAPVPPPCDVPWAQRYALARREVW